MADQDPKTPQQNIDWAETEIIKYRAKIADLEAYKRVERDKIPTLFDAPASPMPPPQRGAKKVTILDMLATSEGMRTIDIVSECSRRGLVGSTVQNTSPQLSEYGKGGLVRHEGGIWRITKAGRDYLAQKN